MPRRSRLPSPLRQKLMRHQKCTDQQLQEVRSFISFLPIWPKSIPFTSTHLSLTWSLCTEPSTKSQMLKISSSRLVSWRTSQPKWKERKLPSRSTEKKTKKVKTLKAQNNNKMKNNLRSNKSNRKLNRSRRSRKKIMKERTNKLKARKASRMVKVKANQMSSKKERRRMRNNKMRNSKERKKRKKSTTKRLWHPCL